MSPPATPARAARRDTPAPVRSLEEFRRSADNLAGVRSINPKGFHTVAYHTFGHDGPARPVVCVHGVTRHGGDFDPLAKALARDRKVVCPDLVGRGASDWLPDPKSYHVPQYNCDLTAIMAATGLAEVDWIGTSLGGLCGIVMAGMPNTPIRRLVINDVAPEVPLSALRRVSDYLTAPLRFADLDEAERHMRDVYRGFGPMSDEDWREMARTSVYLGEDGLYAPHFDPGIGVNFRQYWMLYRYNIWSYWKRISCPLLIIRGTQSDFLTPDLLERMLALQPDAEVREVEEVGHTPTFNTPEQVAPIHAWLEKK